MQNRWEFPGNFLFSDGHYLIVAGRHKAGSVDARVDTFPTTPAHKLWLAPMLGADVTPIGFIETDLVNSGPPQRASSIQ